MEANFEELQDRFIGYICSMIEIIDAFPAGRMNSFLGERLIQSCYLPGINYRDINQAGSRNEFILIMSDILKYLKECRMLLKIMRKLDKVKPPVKLELVFSETEQLIAIIGKSIGTASKNKRKLTAELVD